MEDQYFRTQYETVAWINGIYWTACHKRTKFGVKFVDSYRLYPVSNYSEQLNNVQPPLQARHSEAILSEVSSVMLQRAMQTFSLKKLSGN